jgi:hypothetical protein
MKITKTFYKAAVSQEQPIATAIQEWQFALAATLNMETGTGTANARSAHETAVLSNGHLALANETNQTQPIVITILHS